MFSGLVCGTTYTLGVDAYDAAGNRSTRSTFNASTALCADSTPPSVPQGLRTAAATQTSITLAWNASTDNIGVVGYHMYRDNIPVADTPNLTYTYTGLTCGTLYNLALEAYDAAGNVSYRAQAVAVVTTNACSDTQAPTTPTGLAATGITSSAVTVGWTASTDNVGVAGYGYYSNGNLVGNGTGTSYTFNGLTCNTAYTFAIDAYDAAGNRSAGSAGCRQDDGCVCEWWVGVDGGFGECVAVGCAVRGEWVNGVPECGFVWCGDAVGGAVGVGDGEAGGGGVGVVFESAIGSNSSFIRVEGPIRVDGSVALGAGRITSSLRLDAPGVVEPWCEVTRWWSGAICMVGITGSSSRRGLLGARCSGVEWLYVDCADLAGHYSREQVLESR